MENVHFYKCAGTGHFFSETKQNMLQYANFEFLILIGQRMLINFL